MDAEVRTAEEVLNSHLALKQSHDLERDLQSNLAADCVLLTGYGVFHGHDGVRRAAAMLYEQLGEAHFDYRTVLVHGEMGFLEWGTDAARAVVRDGADSYLIRCGKIQVMTIHYTVEPKER